MKPQKLLILALLLVSGFLLLHHHLQYQPLVAPGDHGRDLYAFQATMQGATPYRNYWWVYGPLTPYYYAFFFKLLGVSISSVLWGKLIFNLISGIFVFLILGAWIPPLLAYTAALWFWLFQPDFFFTYNHVGGITMLLAATYAFFRYIQDPRTRYLYGALISLFLLSLIKVNFGLMTLFTLVAIVFFSDKYRGISLTAEKQRFYLTAAILPFVVILIYALLTRGLAVHEIRQCFPYLPTDHPNRASLWTTLGIWWEAIAINININWPNRFFALLLIASIIQTAFILYRKKVEAPIRQGMILVITTLCILYLVQLHEFLVSYVLYRSFWAKPFSILLIFLFIGFAARQYARPVQILITVTIVFIVLLRYTEQIAITQHKLPEQYIAMERGQVFTGNTTRWHATVKETVAYLKTHLERDELFFALAYDPLYYYFTDKPSPTRQLIFFDHINIPPEQEQKIIRDLEAQDVKYMVISNRSYSGQQGLGVLGTTYCPLLGKFIHDHYQEVARFGDWQSPPGWAWNHGTRIMKRK